MGKYSLADLANRFAVFRRSRLDRYGKPEYSRSLQPARPANPVLSSRCELCKDTGRTVVVFEQVNGNGLVVRAVGPWSKDCEPAMAAAHGGQARVFRCTCKGGKEFNDFPIWNAETEMAIRPNQAEPAHSGRAN